MMSKTIQTIYFLSVNYIDYIDKYKGKDTHKDKYKDKDRRKLP